MKNLRLMETILFCAVLSACNTAHSVESPKASDAGQSSPTAQKEVAAETKPVPIAAETLAELEKAEKDFSLAPDLPVRVNRVALTYAAQGQFGEAEKLLKRVVDLLEKPQVKATMQLAVSLNNLGLIYMQQKKYGKAEPLFQKSLVLQQASLSQSDPTFASSINNLATLYYEQMRYKDALPLFSRAMEIYKLRPVGNALALSKTLNNVASCYSNMKEYTKAETYLKQSLEIEEKLPSNAAGLASALNNLGYIYLVQAKYEEAQPLLDRALSIAEKIYDPKSMDLISYLDNNSFVLRKTNKVKEADKLKARAHEILLANNR